MKSFNPNLDLNLYKVFYAVAEAKSFSKAAEILCVTQPAISHSIHMLEQSLDTKLFLRGAKGVTLTSEAETLLIYIKTAYNYIDIAEKTIRDSKELLQGEVRIGIPTHLASILLVDKLKNFNERYPKVKLHVQSKSTKNLVSMLDNHELDIIIDNYPITKEKIDSTTKKIYTLDTVFATSKKLYDKYNGKLNGKTINEAPIILPHAQATTRKKFDEFLANRGIKINPKMEISSTEIAIKMIKEDMGIAWLIRDSITNEKGIYEVETEIELPKMYIGIAYIDKFLSYAAKRFLEEEMGIDG